MNQVHEKEVQAKSIGTVAYKSLAEVRDGMVFGRTSRGIFIQTRSKWLIFLSFERFRGPLTINLATDLGFIRDISEGMAIEISAHNLFFPETGWNISLKETDIWRPQTATGPVSADDDRRARLLSLANKIVDNNYNSGLAPILPGLLKGNLHQEPNKKDQPRLYEQILDIHQEMNISWNFPPPSALISILGSGTGLTPSGDDFILGMLLTLNHWGNLFPSLPELNKFNQEIVDAAYQKTTTLSANLIECASSGVGNERLIDGLDWLINGIEGETSPGDNLISWGNSSGVDVFVGYVVSLSIFLSQKNSRLYL